MSETNAVRLYTLALIAVLIYGATAAFTKVATGSADGVTVGAMRAVVAAPLAALVILIGRHRIPVNARRCFLIFVSGTGGLVLFPVLFSWGVQHTTAGHAAAGTAFGAVMAGVLAAIIDRRIPGWRWWVGIVTGTAGALLLIWEAIGIEVAGVSWQGDVLVFIGMFMGVVGYIAGARLTKEIGSTTVTMWSVVVAAALLIPLVAVHSGMETLRGIDTRGWMAILALGWGSTILAYLLWNRALADGGIAKIGALQLLQPVIGIGLALLLLGEPLTPPLVVATGVILSGVVLVQRERN
jgi:drug/metabolite transporter (DMT)-like permease